MLRRSSMTATASFAIDAMDRIDDVLAVFRASWLQLLGFAITAAITALTARAYRQRREFRDLPGPPHSWLWGHLHVFSAVLAEFPEDTHQQVAITTMQQRYKLPGAWYLDLWPVSASQFIITDPDLATHVTVTRSHPKHPAEAAFVVPIAGKQNLVSANGAEWKAMHRVHGPAFAMAHVKGMAADMAVEAMEFRRILGKFAESQEVFKLEDALKNKVCDTFCRAAFGRPVGAQQGDTRLMDGFMELCDANMLARYSFNPLHFLPAMWTRRRINRQLDALIGRWVKERRQLTWSREIMRSRQKSRQCIVDMTLDSHLGILRDGVRVELNAARLQSVVEQVKGLLLAGTGTTTSTMSFLFVVLSLYPDVLRKMREEHDRVFARGIDATYELLLREPNRLNELPYTTNVIKEILRMYPVGHTIRGPDAAGEIVCNGQRYSTKDKMVLVINHTIHHDPKYFCEPAKFDPDRFERDAFPSAAYRPFERGNRACLGQNLAMQEIKVTMLLTARDFDFTPEEVQPNKIPRVPWTDLDTKLGDRAFQILRFEGKPRDGMPVSIKRSTWNL